MVIDELIVIENGEQKFVDSADNKVIDVIKYNNTDYHFAKENESTGICDNAVSEPIIDLRVSGNSVQDGTPSPETPVEIESVGEKTKNVFDYRKMLGENTEVSTNGITFKIVDGGVLVNGTATSSANSGRKFNLKTYLETGKTYTAGLYPEMSGVGIIFYSIANGEVDWKNTKTITGNEETIAVYLQVGSGITLDNVLFRLQLEEGSKKTEYEPYGYKVPVKITPTIYEFNPEKISEYKYTNVLTRLGFDLGVLEAGQYVIDFDLVEEGVYPDYLYIRYIDEEGKFSSAIYVTAQRDFTPVNFTADGKSHYYLYFAGLPIDIERAKNEFKRIKNIYLQKGVSIESDITNIYLNEPLRKVGDYIDYVDYKNKKVVRQVGINTTDFVFHGYISDKYLYIRSSIFNDMLGNSLSCMSNRIESFIKFPGSANNNRLQVNNQTFYYLVETEESNQQYYIDLLSGTEIQYPLATPTEETIDIPEISTANGTNIFDIATTIAPSGIKVNYWKQIMPEEVNNV